MRTVTSVLEKVKAKRGKTFYFETKLLSILIKIHLPGTECEFYKFVMLVRLSQLQGTGAALRRQLMEEGKRVSGLSSHLTQSRSMRGSSGCPSRGETMVTC